MYENKQGKFCWIPNSFRWTNLCVPQCCGIIRLWLEGQLQSRMLSQVLSDHKLWPWIQSCWRWMASSFPLHIFTPTLMQGHKGLHLSGHWHTIRCGSGLGQTQPFPMMLNVGLPTSILMLGWENAIGCPIIYIFDIAHRASHQLTFPILPATSQVTLRSTTSSSTWRFVSKCLPANRMSRCWTDPQHRNTGGDWAGNAYSQSGCPSTCVGTYLVL